MVYYLKTGEFLPLNVFLDGEESNKTIRARVFGSSGQLIGEATLTHVNGGYYHNLSAIMMPQFNAMVTAMYEIFDDAVMQVKSPVYTTVVDQFLPARAGSDGGTFSSGTLDASRELVGHVELLSVTAQVETEA